MARIREIDDRLWRWAEWRKVGDGSGYPVKSVLHEDWSPPSPGVRLGMRVIPASDARETDRAFLRLSDKLRAVVVLRYIKRLSASEAGVVLQCKPDTVLARVERAHVALSRLLTC